MEETRELGAESAKNMKHSGDESLVSETYCSKMQPPSCFCSVLINLGTGRNETSIRLIVLKEVIF